MKKHIKKLYTFKIFRYIIGWWLAAVIDLVLLYVFTEHIGLHYIVSSVIAFVFAFSFWYLFQKHVTFENKDKKHVKQWGLFLLFQLIWMFFNVLLLWVFVEYVWIYYIYVAIMNKVIIFWWNFYMNNRYNFK